jgi:hypothetical protein
VVPSAFNTHPHPQHSSFIIQRLLRPVVPPSGGSPHSCPSCHSWFPHPHPHPQHSSFNASSLSPHSCHSWFPIFLPQIFLPISSPNGLRPSLPSSIPPVSPSFCQSHSLPPFVSFVPFVVPSSFNIHHSTPPPSCSPAFRRLPPFVPFVPFVVPNFSTPNLSTNLIPEWPAPIPPSLHPSRLPFFLPPFFLPVPPKTANTQHHQTCVSFNQTLKC